MAEASQFAELRELVTLIKADKDLNKQYNKANAEQRRELIATIQESGEKSNADNISMHKEMVSLEKQSAKDRKTRAAKDTREAFTLRKQLYDKGITDEGFLSRAESDRASGLKINMESAQADYESYQLRREYERRDEQKKADDAKKEDRKIALAEKSLQSMKGQLEQLGLNQDFAERMAKKAMQMKESVSKWWEDKKEGMKKMGSSLLEWVLKGAGLFLLWKFFDYLSKTNLKELYDTMVTALDFLWTGAKTFGAWIGGIKVFKWIDNFFKGNKGWLKFKDFWKGFGGKITQAFKNFKISGLITKIVNLFKAGGGIFKMIFKAFGGGASLKVWEGIISSIKGVFKMITGPFGKEGGIGKAFGKITKFLTMIPGMKTVTKFAGGVLKFIGRLFAPVMLVWGIIESIFAGWDAAEKEKGGLGQKILAFMSGALKKLLDFFVFDLANMVQDGIKWAIKWVMSLFGFSEEEQKKATDWDLVGAVRDALFKAIDWVKNLFKFDGKGISFKGLAPLVDILMFPLNAAINWVRSLFGWDKNKDGSKKKDFSIGEVLTDALDAIFKWIGDLFKIDFGALAKNIMPAALYNFLFDKGSKAKQELNKMGLIDEDLIGDDDLELDKIKEAIITQKKKGGNIAGLMNALTTIANDESIDAGDRKKLVEMLKKEGATLATGGLFSGGMALVGEAGPEIMVSTKPAKVIPAKQTADIMSGGGIGGGGDTIAPTIINSSNAETTMVANSSSHNPYSDKYFRN